MTPARWARRGGRLVVVLPRGADVLEGILAAAAEAGVASGTFVGLGAIEDPRLAWFDRDTREYRDRVLPGVWEIAQLTGNLTRYDGEPRIHAHATVSGPDLTARAGHLVGGTVGVTCEVSLSEWDPPVERRLDPAFDLPLIDLGPGPGAGG